MTPMKAIRAKCLECAESMAEVRECPVKDCSLYPFRMGHRPEGQKRELTEEQKAALSERMAKVREQKGV